MSSRKDHRSSDQIRPMAMKAGVLSRSDGSCRYTCGDSIVVGSVVGPMVEMQADVSQTCRLNVTVYGSSLDGGPASRVMHVEKFIRGALEQVILLRNFPRSCIKLSVQVINDGGSVWACALMACTAALVNAGIPMRGIPSASSCVVLKNGEIVVDPSGDEEKLASAHVFVATMDRHAILVVDTDGVLTRESFKEAVEVASCAAHASRDFINQYFLDFSEKLLKD